MKLSDRMRRAAVVAINEYPMQFPPIGHMDVSFYFHGNDQVTYGYNSTGVEVKGKFHPQSFMSLTMRGGVFVENSSRAEKAKQVHYVIVSDSNYRTMLAFARTQAQITAARRGMQRYLFASHNCVDFVYQVFQVAALTPEEKDVDRYLNNRWEPVAVYSRLTDGYYEAASTHDTRKPQAH